VKASVQRDYAVCSAAAAAEFIAVYTNGTITDAEETWPVSDISSTAASGQQTMAVVVPALPAALLAAPGDSTAAQELKAELLTSWRIHPHSCCSGALR
jgi:hypothetical protein